MTVKLEIGEPTRSFLSGLIDRICEILHGCRPSTEDSATLIGGDLMIIVTDKTTEVTFRATPITKLVNAKGHTLSNGPFRTEFVSSDEDVMSVATDPNTDGDQLTSVGAVGTPNDDGSVATALIQMNVYDDSEKGAGKQVGIKTLAVGLVPDAEGATLVGGDITADGFTDVPDGGTGEGGTGGGTPGGTGETGNPSTPNAPEGFTPGRPV